MKKKIAIIAGGYSGEYEISVNSAEVVYNNLDRQLYDPYIILIKKKQWCCVDEFGERIDIDKNDFSLKIRKSRISFDCVFNAIHGTPGEDGKLQGYFDLLGIPYSSCDLTTSAITFNKYYANRLAATFGIEVANSQVLRRGKYYDPEKITNAVGLPCFVKPNAGGSSVGTTRVNRLDEFEEAVEIAFLEDDQVLVETYIPGREITCGVLKVDGELRTLPLTEVVSSREFFDYEAKYTEGLAKEITPARVDEDIATACRKSSLLLYEEFNCKGVVRFDYIFNEEGLFFLEVNTIPGLSEASIVPQQAEIAGISLSELFGMLIAQADV